MAGGKTICRPHRLASEPPAIQRALSELVAKISAAHPGLPNARWIALRLLGGDEHMAEALRSGELGRLQDKLSQPVEAAPT